MRRLSRAVSTWDAMRIVSRSTRDRSTLLVTLRAPRRRIRIRANTSDVDCLEKVFVDREYRLPVEANPAFAVRPVFIVDGGANIGMSTLFFANMFPGARIVAVEPEPANFALLTENCRGLKGVTMEQAALWPSRAALQLVDSESDNWAFSVKSADSGAATTVRAMTVPDLLAQSDSGRIDLLKLDIEGAEQQLFDDSCAAWLPHVGLIVIELHDRFGTACARQFYSRLIGRPFVQEILGENIFVVLPPASEPLRVPPTTTTPASS